MPAIDTFEQIIKEAEEDLRRLLNIPASYKVLFLQGGASLQFSMAPMNLLAKDRSADYIITGSWGQGAIKEAVAHLTRVSDDLLASMFTKGQK